MEDTIRRVLAAFGLRCVNIKKDKAAFLCGTDAGLVRVEKPDRPPSRIRAAHMLKERLTAAGCATDNFRVALNGEPFAVCADELYTASAAIKAPELDFADIADFRRAITAAAKMHAALKGADTAALPVAPPVNVEAEYAAAASAIRRYRKLIDKSRPYSDFDVAFLSKRAFYERLLADWRGFALNQPPPNAGEICHNALKEEYILLDRDTVYITSFREASAAPQTNDLAELLERRLRHGQGISFTEAVALYSEANPMDEAAQNRLAVKLLFPDRFLALCAKYYEKKRSWIPATFAERLEVVTKTDEARLAYVREDIS